jgi:hypothetical protein
LGLDTYVQNIFFYLGIKQLLEFNGLNVIQLFSLSRAQETHKGNKLRVMFFLLHSEVPYLHSPYNILNFLFDGSFYAIELWDLETSDNSKGVDGVDDLLTLLPWLEKKKLKKKLFGTFNGAIMTQFFYIDIIDFANLKITNPTTMPKCGYITTHITMFEII